MRGPYPAIPPRAPASDLAWARRASVGAANGAPAVRRWNTCVRGMRETWGAACIPEEARSPARPRSPACAMRVRPQGAGTQAVPDSCGRSRRGYRRGRAGAEARTSEPAPTAMLRAVEPSRVVGCSFALNPRPGARQPVGVSSRRGPSKRTSACRRYPKVPCNCDTGEQGRFARRLGWVRQHTLAARDLHWPIRDSLMQARIKRQE